MFKCTVCQKLHNTRVEYCECGNDELIEVSQTYEASEPAKSSVTPQQVISYAVFCACLAASGWVWFGTDTPKAHVNSVVSKQEAPQTTPQTTADIPSIDKLWDSTPAYTEASSGSKIASYKTELQNALYANLEEKEIFEDGRCEIEFKVGADGKLSNRKIYKQQGGSGFNNLVLKMLKQTSKVSAPPSGYANVSYKASVFTENGQVKVLLK